MDILQNEQTDDFLFHYGIMGMKWGVRRDAYKEAHADFQKELKKLSDSGKGNDIKAITAASAKYDARRKAIKKNLTSSNTKTSLEISDKDSPTTKNVKKDYNTLNDQEFSKKYQVNKATYNKRVKRYGDPFMNSPLAKLGKMLSAKNLKSGKSMISKHANTKVTTLTSEQKAKIRSGEVSYYKTDGTPVKLIGF